MELVKQEHPSPGHHDRRAPSTTPRPSTWPWAAPPTPCSTCPPSPTSAASSIDLDMANEINAKTPNLCHLAPAGHTYMEDLDGAGGVYAVMKELTQEGLCWTPACITCHRQDRRREHRQGADNLDPEIIRPIDNPYMRRPAASPCSSGNLAPDGCVVKQSAVAPEMMRPLPAPPGCSTARRTPSPPSTPAASSARRRGGHPLRGPQGRPRHA